MTGSKAIACEATFLGHNPSMHRLYLVALLFLLTIGCTPMRFSQYSGNSNSWPVSQESMAETRYKLPVYRGWPNRPYLVLGSVSFEDPRAEWNEGIIEKAVDEGKERHADALIIRQGSEFGASRMAGFSRDPESWIVENQTTALLIKWKSDSEIDSERSGRLNLKELFQRNHPEYARSSAIDLAIELLSHQGISPNSPDAQRRLLSLFEGLGKPVDSQLDGRWIYKVTIERNSVSSRFTETLYGIATVRLTLDSLVIVSVSGEPELNFSGFYQNGRVTGKVGLGTLPMSKSEGVATPDKISITGEGRSPDSVVQASIVLQR